jgi:hypothetical protein
MRASALGLLGGLLFTALLSACGGGGGGGTTTAGGIGGTGITASGTVTGFGSVFVNGVEFRTTGTTITINDDTNRPESELQVGMVVEVKGALDASGKTGTATSIRFRDNAQAQVQSVDLVNNTVVVLGQTVKVDNNTVFAGTGLAAATDLKVNDVVQVSGFDDGSAAGMIRATRVEKTGTFAPGVEVEVKGTISSLNALTKTFNVRNLAVNYATASLSGFPATGPANGQRVEVKGTQFSGATFVAVQVKLEDANQVPDGDKAEIEGLISDFVSLSNFKVSGQAVNASAATIEHSAGITVSNGVKVEVEGTISNGVLVATKLSVRQSGDDVAESDNVNIKIESIATAVNATGNTFVVLTKTIAVNALTQFDDKSSVKLRTFNLASITPNADRLAVRAYEDTSGNLVATRVERTKPDSRIVLQGPVDAKTIATNLTIIGVTVQTGPSTQYKDAAGNTVTPSAFFSAVSAPPAPSSIVKVQGVAGPGSGNTIDATNGEAEIED